MARKHTRIIQHPLAASLQGALLDSHEEEQRDGQLHITLSVRTLKRASSELFERGGVIYERVKGKHIPAKLYFSGVSEFQANDSFTSLTHLPRNDSTRTISDLLS